MEQTEKATPRKLAEARKKGTVSQSPDLTAAVSLLAGIIVCALGQRMLLDMMRSVLRIAFDFIAGEREWRTLCSALLHVFGLASIACVVVGLAGSLGGVLGSAMQIGLKVTFEPVMPKLDKLNPAVSLKRMFSSRALLDFVKMLVKAGLLGVVMSKTLSWLFPLITRGVYEPLPQLSALLWGAALRMLGVAFVLYLLLGAADWKIQHWIFLRSQRMTKDEVKRERKNSEGDPKVKSERKKRAKELAQGAPAASDAISRAGALVVNPTHYAVALRYAPSESALPVVLLAGVDADAATLRRLASLHDVPIVSNPPLARALYRVPAGSPIPEALFEVVAAVLRWVESVGVAACDPQPRPARVQY
jgi:type III secretion protein U